VGLKSLNSLNLTNVYPNNKKNNKVKSKPLELRSRVKIVTKTIVNKLIKICNGVIENTIQVLMAPII
jgi:hypothetical protein